MFSTFKKSYYNHRKTLKIIAQKVILLLRILPKSTPWKSRRRKRVLIFCPEAAIHPHFDAMQILGKMIENCGADVRWIRCDGGMLRCPAHDMNQVPWTEDQSSAKATTCIQCRWHAGRSHGLGLEKSVSWNYYLPPPLMPRDRSLAQKKPLKDFSWKGVRLGELATGATRMLLKMEPGRWVSPDYRNYWSMTYRASVQSYEGMRRLLEQWRPDLLLHYDQYPVLLSARIAAVERGITVRTVSHTLLNGIDREKVQVFESTGNKMIRKLAELWPILRQKPFFWEQVQVSAEDLISRMRGGHTHVFSRPLGKSSNLSIYQDLVATGKKILVAFTSSEDEVGVELAISRALGIRECRKSSEFADQAEWLTWLRDYADKSGHHVVIRIHPREAGTSRNPRRSHQNLDRLKRILRGTSNLSVVWPESQISSYDLFHIAHAATISYSSIGLEAARSGIPVVTAFGPPYYEQPSLAMMRRVHRLDEYQKLLDTWMGGPLFLDPAAWTDVFRWHYLTTAGSSLNLDPSEKLPISQLLNMKIQIIPPGKINRPADSPEKISHLLASNLEKFFLSHWGEGSASESSLLTRLQSFIKCSASD